MKKNKKNFISRVIIGIISLIILIMVCISPNLFKKLQGNVNSIDTSSNMSINTGVVIDTNLVFDKTNNEVPLKIYNGAKSDITINSYIYRTYCPTNNGCEEFTKIDLENPITINKNKEIDYTLGNLNFSNSMDVGLSYVLDGKTYIISLPVFNEIEFDANSINIIESKRTEEEFLFTADDSWNGGHNIYVTLTDNNIHMNIDENIEDLDVLYKLKSSFEYNWFFESPLRESGFNANMFGEPNKANIRNYLNIEYDNQTYEGKGAFDYNSGKQFKLNGSPKGIYTGVTVIPTFYFLQYKYILLGPAREYTYTSNDNYPFKSDKIPQFSLTVYDKSELKNAIINAINKLKVNKVSEVDINSYIGLRDLIYNEAIICYQTRDVYNGKDVNQANIDQLVKKINNYTIQNNSNADYTALNSLSKKIDSLNINHYEPASFNNLKNVYNEKSEILNLSSSYQSKVDNYVDRLNSAFEALVMYDADYAAVDEAIKIANQIKNTTPDGKYELYTKESWQALQDVISSVDRTLKIKDQAIVDGYVTRINEAKDALEIASAKYDDLNKVIDDYKNSEGYKNNWYTAETKNTVENYIASITDDKKITEQEDVDIWTSKLKVLISKLKYIKALGYYDTDNYKPFEGALSVEGYIRYFKELNREFYTDVTLLFVDTLISEYEIDTDAKFNITIDRQSEMDDLIKEYDDIIKNQLVMKNADYSKIKELKEKIEKLDANKYTNFETIEKVLNEIVWDKKITEQSEVDLMYQNLKAVFENLEEVRADYTKLEKAIASIKKYEENKDIYSNYEFIKKVIDMVIEDIDYNLTWSKQYKIDVWANKINEALGNLVKKSADYSKLSKIISKLPNDYSKYDKNVQEEINTFVKEVKALPNSLKIDEQYKIDILVEKGNKLLKKLSGIILDDKTDNTSDNTGNNVETIKPNVSTTTKTTGKKPSNNAEEQNKRVLSYIEVNGDKVDITAPNFKYTVSYVTTEAKIKVGLLKDEYTSKVYGGDALVPGENNITIIVTDKTGKEYKYNLVIIRLMTSNYLSDLSIKNYSINFNKTKTEYTVRVDKNTDKLDLEVLKEDIDSKVTVKGNKNLKNGSKVTIEVISSDGNVRIYTINVQKAGTINAGIVVIFIMILAVLSGVFKFIQDKKKN